MSACKHRMTLVCVEMVLALVTVGAASDLPEHLVLYYDFDEEGLSTISDRSS